MSIHLPPPPPPPKPPSFIRVASTIGQLIREYKISTHGSNVLQPIGNPFAGKIAYKNTPDAPLREGGISGAGIFSDLTLQGGYWSDNDGTQYTFDTINFETVLMAVQQTKEIVKTVITGRAGTVKEYIAEGDFEIQVNGIITSSNGVYPFETVRAFKALLDAPVPIECVSKHLQNLDVHSLVISSYNISQEPGMYSQQPFSFTAISDLPVELQISNV